MQMLTHGRRGLSWVNNGPMTDPWHSLLRALTSLAVCLHLVPPAKVQPHESARHAAYPPFVSARDGMFSFN